jgi:hypothetical protein
MTSLDPVIGKDSEHPLSYHYLPLDTRHDEVRLLSIPRKTPGSDAAINCTLFHTSLSEARSFIALSYCWGDHTLKHQIAVNERMMYVTESLATALINIQSGDEDILLWADAICINQKDAIEKTTQVHLMRDIYRTASQVIIWLGQSTPDTYYTMREMRRLGDQLIHAGLWELSLDDILHWDAKADSNVAAAATKRAILQLSSEHLAKARNDEFPFWWIMSDLGKRKWFHASTTSTDQLLIPNASTFAENLVHSRMHKCQNRNISLWQRRNRLHSVGNTCKFILRSLVN